MHDDRLSSRYDKVTLMGTNQDGRKAPQGDGSSPTQRVVTETHATLGIFAHWTTEQLKEHARLTGLVVEATSRRANLVSLSKHARDQALNPVRHAPKAIQSHAQLNRQITVTFDDHWFVGKNSKGELGLFLRDPLYGYLVLIPSDGDEHWIAKTVPSRQQFLRTWGKHRALKEHYVLLQQHLISCIRAEYEEEQEHEKNVEVVSDDFIKADPSQQDQGVFWLQNMFEAMEHENLMRLRAHLGITESPNKGKAGRPSNNAYREQVREHLDKTDNWTVIVTPF